MNTFEMLEKLSKSNYLRFKIDGCQLHEVSIDDYGVVRWFNGDEPLSCFTLNTTNLQYNWVLAEKYYFFDEALHLCRKKGFSFKNEVGDMIFLSSGKMVHVEIVLESGQLTSLDKWKWVMVNDEY